MYKEAIIKQHYPNYVSPKPKLPEVTRLERWCYNRWLKNSGYKED